MEDEGPIAFAADLAHHRAAEGLSPAGVAAAAHVHRGYLHHVETGQRRPAEPVARLLDDTLHARGALLAAWHDGETARRLAASDARRVATSVRESQRLDVLLDDVLPGVLPPATSMGSSWSTSRRSNASTTARCGGPPR